MDAFAELGLERDLRVSEEDLRGSFDRASLERHPDAGGDREGFARLRESYDILRGPGRRLRHWLELEGVELRGAEGLPEGVLGLFGEVGGLLQRVEAGRERKAEARSALGRSMVEREMMGLTEELEAMGNRVAARTVELEGRFGEFQEKGAVEGAAEAVGVAAELVFLEKWSAQLREAWVGLAVME